MTSKTRNKVPVGGMLFGCLIFLFIAVVLTLIFGSLAWNVAGGNQMVGEKAAKEYAANVPGVTAVQCNRFDTDADGYVTCTLFRGTERPLQIECGLSGCRMPKLLIQQE